MKLAKPQRQHRIARLLEHHAVTSQAQVVDLLAGEGVVATQATVSRDLEELGAVKVRMPGGETVYAVPQFEERPAPEEQLKRVFSRRTWSARPSIGRDCRTCWAPWPATTPCSWWRPRVWKGPRWPAG